MLNFHLNGDIVRCPDIRAIQLRALERRDIKKICKYNIHEDQCQAWQNSLRNWQNVKNNNDCGRCQLSGSDLCPGHQKRKELGNKQKTFKIDNSTYRKLTSSAHYMVKESKTKTLFTTLSFPKFKRNVSNKEINQYFSRFVENLRQNYDCSGYIAVRERGEKNNRVHFHLLLSIPFIDFRVLNDSWCNCIKDICHYSRNALTSDPKTRIINNPQRALRYICKYFSKAKNQVSATRLIFISNNILQVPKNITGSIEDILKGYKGIYINQTSDFSTCFRITDNKSFERFCNEFLYPLFELSIKNNGRYNCFPLNTS